MIIFLIKTEFFSRFDKKIGILKARNAIIRKRQQRAFHRQQNEPLITVLTCFNLVVLKCWLE